MVIDVAEGMQEKWEAFSNREQVIYSHLEPLYKAQDALAELIAFKVSTGDTREPTITELELWGMFFSLFGRNIQRARIKIEVSKNKKTKELVNEGHGIWLNRERAPYKKMDEILYQIGLLYDELGYSRAERKKNITGFVSDIGDGIGDVIESEAV